MSVLSSTLYVQASSFLGTKPGTAPLPPDVLTCIPPPIRWDSTFSPIALSWTSREDFADLLSLSTWDNSS